MNTFVKKLSMAAAFALAFLFSCSLLDKDSKDNGDSGGPICSNVHSVPVLGEELLYGECYDGSSAIIESLCETFGVAEFQYESHGKCPDGEIKSCDSNTPFLFAVLHEYGESLLCD